MSIAIPTLANIVGVTVPFAGYMGAFSLVAAFSGPIGWTIAGVLTVAGVALMGRASYRKSFEFIAHMHLSKVSALTAAGTDASQVFGSWAG
jgi:hypothetical protein